MYRVTTYLMAAVMALSLLVPVEAVAQHRRGPPPRHYHYRHSHSHGWSTTGKILTGVALGGLLLNSYQPPPPPRREVISYRTVYHGTYTPAPVQEVRIIEPAAVVTVPARTTMPAYPVAETVWVRNSNGSETPVELRRNGNGHYIGPKGEYYTGRPDNEQLRLIYGL